MHLPRGAVEIKMRADGVDPALLDSLDGEGGDGGGSGYLTGGAVPQANVGQVPEKYLKMLKVIKRAHVRQIDTTNLS